MMLIRVIDVETTGIEPVTEHAVCEIGWCDVVADPDLAGGWTNWQVETGGARLIKPGRPIPPEASAIHHIIDADVAEAMSLSAAFAAGFPGDAPDAYAAHSAKFERQWITDDLTGGKPWICTYKAALRLWPEAPQHSNQALRYWRRPEGMDRTIAAFAHRAGPDAYATAFLLRDMLATTPVEKLIEWAGQPALQVRCHIGKNRGMLWSEVDDGFLHWILGKDFDEDVLFTVRHELDRRERAAREGAAA